MLWIFWSEFKPVVQETAEGDFLVVVWKVWHFCRPCRKKHVGFELWLVWLGMSSYTSVQPLTQTSFWQPVAFRNINLQQARKNGEFAINFEDTKILENLLHRTIQYSRTPEFKNLYTHTNRYWLLWIYVFMLDTIYQKISNQLRASMSNLNLLIHPSTQYNPNLLYTYLILSIYLGSPYLLDSIWSEHNPSICLILSVYLIFSDLISPHLLTSIRVHL